MNFNHYIYILYSQSNLLDYFPPNPVSYPYRMKYFICNGGVGTLVNITPWRYVNDVTQQTKNVMCRR